MSKNIRFTRRLVRSGICPAMKLVYIGDRFYSQSGSIMSSLYTENGRERFDWGFVQCLLRDGKSVIIRPATSRELDHYESKLNEIIAQEERDRLPKVFAKPSPEKG